MQPDPIGGRSCHGGVISIDTDDLQVGIRREQSAGMASATVCGVYQDSPIDVLEQLHDLPRHHRLVIFPFRVLIHGQPPGRWHQRKRAEKGAFRW